MDVAAAGLDRAMQERVANALLPGTRLVPCGLDALEGDAAGKYAAIILGPEIPLDTAMRRVRDVDSTHPETPVVLVAPQDPSTLREALLAGARDVWQPDLGQAELSGSLERILEASRVLSTLVAQRGPAGRAAANQVVLVLAAKGGVGQTLVATNLAAGLNAEERDSSVAIVDLDLQFGDVAEAFQLTPASDIADAVRVLDNVPALKTMIAEHPSGLHLLSAPNELTAADVVEPGDVARLVELVSSQFDITVIDGGDGLQEVTLSALDHATSIVVVTTPDPFVVKDTRRMLGVLHQLVPDTVDRRLVLNRSTQRPGLRQREIEATLGGPVDMEIPVSRSVASGLPRARAMLDAGRPERRAMQSLVATYRPTARRGES